MRLMGSIVVALALCGGPLAAQDAWPSKPVRLVVTFPPGGSADLVARAIAPKLAERFHQPFVIDNRPGAGGNIGLDLVAKAAPDGHTLGVGAAGGLAVNVSLYKSMPFDPVKDFAPITMLAEIPFVLAAHPSLDAPTLAALIAQAKTKPGALAVGHGGNGTAMHLSSQLLAMMAGIELTLVPYKGSAPAASDLVAGQIPLAMLDVPSALGFVQADKVKALGVTAAARIHALPEVPTMAEGGVAGYESVGWFGLVAPAGTPAAIVGPLHQAVAAALADPETAQRFADVGAQPASSTPEAFGATLRSEIAKWAKVIAVSGAKVD